MGGSRKQDIANSIPAEEREEWLDAFDALIEHFGSEEAEALLNELESHAERRDIRRKPLPFTSYRNSVSLEDQPPYPGDLHLEERITAMLRWNALAMVMRAN